MKKILIPVLFLMSCSDGVKNVEKVSIELSDKKETINEVIVDTVIEPTIVSKNEIDSFGPLRQESKELMTPLSETEELVLKAEVKTVGVESEINEKKEVVNPVLIEEEEIIEIEDGASDNAKTKDEIWAELLENVRSGKVDYSSLKQRKEELKKYLTMMQSEKPNDAGSKNEKLAYYINLYNASTVSLILDNYPLKTIRDITNPWDIKFVKTGTEVMTLNELENNLIRPTFKEPRIHFALNCAAVACPKLSSRPFQALKLEDQLQKATEQFLNDSSYGMRVEGKNVYLSQIFEWYAADFGGKEKLLNWITKNTSKDLKGYKLKGFIEYNWALNDK